MNVWTRWSCHSGYEAEHVLGRPLCTQALVACHAYSCSLPVQEQFVLENKQKGCIVLEDDFTMSASGRMSFMNYNPEVERINQEHQDRMRQIAVEIAEQDDVSATQMAQVLGKRKQPPADTLAAVEEITRNAAPEDPPQVRVTVSP